MTKLNRQQQVLAAQHHLAQQDPVLRPIIQRVGDFTVRPKRDTFGVLVQSIISQQISTAAARTIHARLVDHLRPAAIAPDSMRSLTVEQFRQLGISQQKARYLIDLTNKVHGGGLELKKLSRHSDQQVIDELVQVKGIGVWTAHMFMIFALGRLDVLPVGDLGIRSAVQKCYALDSLPAPREIEVIAEPWRPYASVASWYLWAQFVSTLAVAQSLNSIRHSDNKNVPANPQNADSA